jgi:1,4-dihydroxy-2-naphthoate octaprenyltransferase
MNIAVLSADFARKTRKQAGIWLRVIRPLFLWGSIAPAFLGTSIAWGEGIYSLHHAVLAFLGLILWHVSAQVLNDYFDYRSGIDLKTRRTPFSGGSGVLPAKLLNPKSVLVFGLLCFVLALPIWIYFLMDKGVLLLPALAVGAVCVLLYTPVLTKSKVPEAFSGIGLGILPVLTCYFVQTGEYTTGAIVGGVASGIVMFNLHLLFEFPDIEADRVGGRKTLPIILGTKKASWLYLASSIIYYAWVISWIVVHIMPQGALLSLLTMPLAFLVTLDALNYQGLRGFPRVLYLGAATYLLTIILLAMGFILERV